MVSDDLDENLVIDQYLTKMASVRNLRLKYISSLDEIPDRCFIPDDHLYVIKADKWDDEIYAENCVVLCKSSKVSDAVKIPKLEDWQVVDYARSIAKGLSKEDLEWLLTRYAGRYMMYINDVVKISFINEGSQKLLFNQMVANGEFDTLSGLTIFDLTNAIIKKDIGMIRETLKIKDYVDITPMHFLTIMGNSFRNIINIQFNPSCTYQDLGISEKQFFVIKKYNCGYYTKNQLVDIMEMITSIEYKFKYEDLPVDKIIEYMIVKILGVL